MKTIPNSRRGHYLAIFCILLTTAALIAGMGGCGPTPQYNLTISSTAGGNVTTPGEGTFTYDAGTVISLNATPDAGYSFVNWTGNVSTIDNVTAALTTITMNGDYTITANFVAIHYNLTMAANLGGRGTATDLTNASPYAAGTEVSIKAVANSGYQFVIWTAPAGIFGNANAAQTTFTMPAQNVTATANFATLMGGSGTEGDPYQIADWYQLYIVGNYPNSYFILVNNLDSTTPGYDELASPTANKGKGWEPIGSWDAQFTKTFDGQGYEIRDLFINCPNEETAGLFGWVDEGVVIKNLGIVNANVTGGWYVGGLVGVNEGTVSNSYSTGNVTGNYQVGGLAGYNLGGTVSNSYSTGNVTGIEDVGGLVGANYGIVSHSYSTGNVNGEEFAVGGLVGGNAGTVSNSYATGSVTGHYYIGGLLGGNSGTVNDSYATGNVTGTMAVAGLAGENSGGTISNSYSTGSVTGTIGARGLVASNSNGGTVSNSFWDIETSGQATSDGGTGKNTTEMKDIATFSGASWNITAVANSGTRNPSYIWNIVNNVTYPFLSWQP